jgi:hypothetical protein
VVLGREVHYNARMIGLDLGRDRWHWRADVGDGAKAVRGGAPALRRAPAWIYLACSFLVTASAFAANEPEAQDRNYRVIIDRNPFGLKPPPPPPTNAPPPAASKDEILLTGITSIGGNKAWFMTKPPQGKNPEYYVLGVDEKKDALEVVAIDLASKSVRVRNAGVEKVMTFASNGVKAPEAAGTPATGTNPPGRASLPGVAASTMPSPFTGSTPMVANSRVHPIPSRNSSSPTMGMNPMMGMNSGVAPNQSVAPPNPYQAATDVLLMELQRKANPNVVFPPTPGLPMPGGP